MHDINYDGHSIVDFRLGVQYLNNFRRAFVLRVLVDWTGKMLGSLLFLLAAYQAYAQEFPVDQCFAYKVQGIPKRHIYHRKCKPLIIGHRGHPKRFQENTLAGFKSVERYGGDGFEVDVFLSKDKKLVCFHDQNAKKLTGVDRNIEDMTSNEIKQLRYKKALVYGNRTYQYDKRRKVAFLEDVLKWATKTRLLVYIEMKPETLVIQSQEAYLRSLEVATHVANIVQKHKMHKRVLINSFDIVKTLHAKRLNDKLLIGNSWIVAYFHAPPAVYQILKNQFKTTLPGLDTCIDDIPSSDKRFVEFFYKTGTIEKSMNAVFTDIDITMFNNPMYGGTSHTVRMLKRNYGRKTIIGAYTFYDLELTDAQVDVLEAKYKRLIRQGVHLLYTDDIPRLRCLAYWACKKNRSCMKRQCHHGGYYRHYSRQCNYCKQR